MLSKNELKQEIRAALRKIHSELCKQIDSNNFESFQKVYDIGTHFADSESNTVIDIVMVFNKGDIEGAERPLASKPPAITIDQAVTILNSYSASEQSDFAFLEDLRRRYNFDENNSTIAPSVTEEDVDRAFNQQLQEVATGLPNENS